MLLLSDGCVMIEKMGLGMHEGGRSMMTTWHGRCMKVVG